MRRRNRHVLTAWVWTLWMCLSLSPPQLAHGQTIKQVRAPRVTVNTSKPPGAISLSLGGTGLDCTLEGADCYLASDQSGGDGDPYTDPVSDAQDFWPTHFEFVGRLSGQAVFGSAARLGTSSTYEFDAIAADGTEYFGIIDLSVAEAVLIDMKISVMLTSFTVTWVEHPGGG